MQWFLRRANKSVFCGEGPAFRVIIGVNPSPLCWPDFCRARETAKLEALQA